MDDAVWLHLGVRREAGALRVVPDAVDAGRHGGRDVAFEAVADAPSFVRRDAEGVEGVYVV